MKKFMLLARRCCAGAFGDGGSGAGDKAKVKAPAAPRTAISIECSKQADAKGLHGKARHSFRNKCKRDGAKAAKSKG